MSSDVDQIMKELIDGLKIGITADQTLCLDQHTLVCHRSDGALLSIGSGGLSDLKCHPEPGTACADGMWHSEETEGAMFDLAGIDGTTLCVDCFDSFEIGVFNNLKDKTPQVSVDTKPNFHPRLS